jgi:hypothetical protein
MIRGGDETSGGGSAMRTTSVVVAGLALAAWTVAAEAQQGPTPGMAPGTYSASKIGQSAAAAESKGADQASKVKANDKAYSAALKNLPDKQYDPWRGVR